MERRESGPREPGGSGTGRHDGGEAPGRNGEEQATRWRSLRIRLRRRARGRGWRSPRLLLLLGLAWILWKHLGDPAYASLFAGINLVIHEAGHLALGWFGTTPGILGGTIFELAAPLAAATAFYRQRDDFAVAVAAFWLGTALVDVGLYAADARARALPLVSPVSGDPVHDWGWILGRLGLLAHDGAIGAAIRGLGLLSMAAALLLGAAVVRAIGPREEEEDGRNNARPPIY